MHTVTRGETHHLWATPAFPQIGEIVLRKGASEFFSHVWWLSADPDRASVFAHRWLGTQTRLELYDVAGSDPKDAQGG